LHEVASGSPKARYAIIDKREARWHATAIALDYRHDLAARRAAEFGAMDWAYSLETGQNTPLACSGPDAVAMRDPISEVTGEHISRGGLSNKVLRGDGDFRRPSAGEKSEA